MTREQFRLWHSRYTMVLGVRSECGSLVAFSVEHGTLQCTGCGEVLSGRAGDAKFVALEGFWPEA